MNPVFRASIKSGKVIFDDVKQFNDYTQTLESKEVEVIVRTPKKPRSLAENSYYWGVIIKILSEQLGLSPDETHETLKYQFLKVHKSIIVQGKIEEFFFMRSTTDLSTKSMEEYLENIRMWAAEFLGCIIPLPNEIE